MTDNIRISVDAMGGDKGPRVALLGARLELRQRKNVSFIFHGRQEEHVQRRPLLARPGPQPVRDLWRHFEDDARTAERLHRRTRAVRGELQ